jgi:fatty-acyl-CoA synthase
MTEASPLITINSPSDSFEKRTQTIGKALEHTELKVVDTKGRIAKLNEPGELLVRGYNTMLGYYDDKKKSEETFTADRFLKTGYIK